MKINEKIRVIRELKGWSQEEMAEKLHMSAGAYSNIERGETNIQFSRLEQVSKILGMKISELTDLEDKNIQLVYENNGNQSQVIFNMSDEKVQHKLEISQLKIEQQQQQISHLQAEIAYLKEIISLKNKQ